MRIPFKRELLKALFIACAGLVVSGCTTRTPQPNRAEHLGGKTLSETIADNAPHLLSLPGVLRVAPGDCGVDSCIKVYVSKKTGLLAAQIPMMLETWQVDVIEEAK